MDKKRYCPFCGTPTEVKKEDNHTYRYCPNCKRNLYDNPVPAVAIAVLDENGKILLVKRGVEPGLGKWSLPGGYINLGETPHQACIRELYEETNLRANNLKLVGVYNQESSIYDYVLLVGYLAYNVKGEAIAGDDAVDLGFFSPDDLPEIAFWSHRAIIEVVSGGTKEDQHNRLN